MKVPKILTSKPPAPPMPTVIIPPPPPPPLPKPLMKPIRAESIYYRVCAALPISPADLSGRTRHPRVVWARRLITCLCREYTTLSYPEIARLIGRPNHSTVICGHEDLRRALRKPPGCDQRMVPCLPDPVDIQAMLAQLRRGIEGAQEPYTENPSGAAA